MKILKDQLLNVTNNLELRLIQFIAPDGNRYKFEIRIREGYMEYEEWYNIYLQTIARTVYERNKLDKPI